MYFLISNSGGDTTVLPIVDIAQFLDELANGEYGDLHFLSEISESDTNYWGECTVALIQGELVAPRPVQVVTKYDI